MVNTHIIVKFHWLIHTVMLRGSEGVAAGFETLWLSPSKLKKKPPKSKNASTTPPLDSISSPMYTTHVDLLLHSTINMCRSLHKMHSCTVTQKTGSHLANFSLQGQLWRR